MLELISGPWHWSVSGLAIALVMFLLLFLGAEFGVSSNLRTMCAIAGAGRKVSFFDYNWLAQRWNLVFVGGAVLGGFLAFYVFPATEPIQLSAETLTYLESINISAPGAVDPKYVFVPAELYAPEFLGGLPALITIILGGFMIGFGARWAGGCTSGHAISGLSNLQLPSLIAVIGFFIGGLFMSWLVMPYLLQL